MDLREMISARASELAWQGQAACRKEGVNAEWFFPSSGNSHAFTQAAKDVCATCPVRDNCLRQGWADGELGTWGGVSYEERQALIEHEITVDQFIELRDQREADEAEDDDA